MCLSSQQVYKFYFSLLLPQSASFFEIFPFNFFQCHVTILQNAFPASLRPGFTQTAAGWQLIG